MTKAIRLLITGATGAIGPAVVREALLSGYQIRTLATDPPKESWGNEVEVVQGDITDSETVSRAMRGMDMVCHMAALLHIFNPIPSMEERYFRINVHGTRNIVVAAADSGVQRIVFPSTIAVYGDSSGQILSENSTTRPDTWYAKTKLEGETIVLGARSSEGRPLGVVLRLGAVYGPRIQGNYRRLLHSLAKRRFIPIGKGTNRRTLVYDRDVARAILLVLSHPGAAGNIYNVSDGAYHTLNQIIETMCRALARPAPKVSIPEGPVRMIVNLVERCSHSIGVPPPVTRSMVDKYTEDMAVDSSLIRSELGFMPAYDLSQGWTETIDIMRRSGEL